MALPWSEVFIVFFVSHLAGDFLLQTDWQAANKHGGLGRDPESRRALRNHVITYTLMFIPAMVWLSDDLGAAALLLVPGLSLPHLIQDDGRLLTRYVRLFKGPTAGDVPLVAVAVDQSFHMIVLLLTAFIAGA
jgi:uncharacterized protein DUF3307